MMDTDSFNSTGYDTPAEQNPDLQVKRNIFRYAGERLITEIEACRILSVSRATCLQSYFGPMAQQWSDEVCKSCACIR